MSGASRSPPRTRSRRPAAEDSDMAGSNPGMVIKVAADIAAASSAFTDIAAEATTTGAAIGEVAAAFDANAWAADIGAAEQAITDLGTAAGATEEDQAALDQAVTETATAYGDLGASAPAALDDVSAATEDVETATGRVSTSVIALGAAIGTFVAEAAVKLAELAISGFGSLASAITDI